MDNDKVTNGIISALNKMRNEKQFNPKIYIGKTSNFNSAYDRHNKEGYPILLRIAEGTPEEIDMLEASLLDWVTTDRTWSTGNTNTGSGGNPSADKLYICLDSSYDNDELYEASEEILLGKGFPINLNNKNELNY